MMVTALACRTTEVVKHVTVTMVSTGLVVSTLAVPRILVSTAAFVQKSIMPSSVPVDLATMVTFVKTVASMVAMATIALTDASVRNMAAAILLPDIATADQVFRERIAQKFATLATLAIRAPRVVSARTEHFVTLQLGLAAV